MKKIGFALLISLLLVLTAGPALAAGPEAAQIICPTEEEAAIAPGRDFYVIARWAGEQKAVSATVLLKDAAGNTVREVESGYTDFYTEHPGLTAFNTDYDGYLMPDLLYDPEDEASLSYAFRKCYVQDNYALALVSGGLWQGIAAHTDKNGAALAPLKAGKYTLAVTFTLADGKTVSCGQELTLGFTENKVITRFSPDYHLAQVQEIAAAEGYRIYLDPFPGYWSPADIFADDSSYFAELIDSWRFANGLEFTAGSAHLFIYNISATCATNAVEIGALRQRDDMRESLNIYCYDYGEPRLVYTALSGVEQELSCGFIPMEDALTINRLQVEKGVEPEDNAFSVPGGLLMTVDTEQADGYACALGDTATLFGTVTPLPTEIVAGVEYVFTQNGQELLRARRPVGLVRELAEGWYGTSVYEFAHSFAIPDQWLGDIQVELRALNELGQPVHGGGESFVLTVSREGAAFRDVSSREEEAIYILAAQGLLQGVGDRYYQPERPITYAELLTMLGRAAGVAPAGEWYEAYMAWAGSQGAEVEDIFQPVPRDAELFALFGLSESVPPGQGPLDRAEGAELVWAWLNTAEPGEDGE